MSRSLLTGFLLALLSGIATGPLRANGVLALSPETPVLLGMGIDLVTGEWKQPCVEWERSEQVSQGQGTRFRYELVEDSRSLKKALAVEATAAYRNPTAHVSARASFAKQVQANSYSLYILALVDVRAPTETLAGVRLKPEIQKVLAEPDGLQRFRRICGDEYVASLNRAGSFMGVIEVQTRDQRSKKRLRTEISGKMQAGAESASGSVELSQAVKTASRSHRVRSFQSVTGQSRTALAVSPDAMVRNAELFPSRITPESALPYQANTFRYDSLLGWKSPAQVDTEHQRFVVRELGKRRDEFEEKLANIEYVLANKAQFQGASPPRLKAMREVLYQNLGRLQEAARTCHRDLTQCSLPTGLEDEDLYQGRRVPLPPQAESLCLVEKEDPACGVATYRSKRDPLCGVEQYKARRDVRCGVETYKLARSSSCGVERYRSKKHKSCGTTLGATKICSPCLKCPKGYKKVKGKLMKLTCRKIVNRTCRKASFGVETYRSCRHQSHGIELFKTCRDEVFGVESYQECAREEFGAATYRKCGRPEFGLVPCP